MKKRLISLLLAVAMMMAMVPTAAFAGDEAGTVNSDLRINADGIPYKEGDTTQNINNESVSGNGWNYYRHRTSQILYLGVDTAANGNINFSTSRFDFSLGSSLSSDCEIVLYNAALSNTTATKAKVIADSAGVSVTNCVLNYLSITTSNSASATVKNCIFTNSSYAIHGFSSCTLEGWNIFANDPGVTEKRTISVTNGGKIEKVSIGSSTAQINANKLYVAGAPDNLSVTLAGGSTYQLTANDFSDDIVFPGHVDLTINENGTPNTTGMTEANGVFFSDDWSYSSNDYTLYLNFNFKGDVGPNPVKCKVDNDGTITGGVFLQKPTGTNITDLHTITAGNNYTFTKLTVADQSVDLNTNELYVVGTPGSELTVDVNYRNSATYHFVIPAGSLTTDLTLDTLYSTGSKKLKIKADGTPDTNGVFYYYPSSVPEIKTYFGGGWHYIEYSSVPSKSTLYLDSDFDLGSTIITVNVYNNATLTGGIIAKGATLTTQGIIQNVVVYGTLSTFSQAHIENCILLNTPDYPASQSPIIQDCIIVNNPGNWKKTALTATDGAKITTIQLGNLTMTLDEPVSEIYFLPGSDSTPKKLTVTLSDGTKYEDIDLTQPVITLAPTKRDDPTTYYSVTVEGGEARNERGDILDSEVALTAGEKITLKLLDETQGEMVFSHWDVNNNDTDLADELAKKGFDKTAHETTFTMPAHNLTLTAKYRMSDEDAPQDDSFLMTAAAVTGGAVLTGLVVWQGYNIFSQVYLNAHLPEGTAIPTNRQQLALLLWNTAGQPEASAASYVFPDVADPDVQTAARWATEQGLFKARKDGTFAPTDSVTTGQVYRAWQKVK